MWRERRIQALLEDLKKQANPQYDKSFFGGADAATQPASAPRRNSSVTCAWRESIRRGDW